MKIFSATCETDTAVIGVYPQIYFYSIEGHERPYDEVWRQRPDPTRSFSMNGVMALEAIRTQVLSCVELSPGRGLLIENVVVELIRRHLPGSALLHRFEVREPINDAVHPDYSYVEVRTTSEFLALIDFGKSSFCTSLFDEYQADIDISSPGDWEAKQLEENRKRSSLTIAPKVLSLDRKFLDATGIIKFPFSSRIFLTEPVARLIIDNRVTGIKLVEERAISIQLQ